MAINRAPFNALIDDDGSNTTGTVWGKQDIKDVLLDPIDAMMTTGTWTPSLGGTATYTQQEGSYVRVGQLVFARGFLAVNAIGTGLGYLITGLPFAVNGHTPGSISLLTAALGAVSYVDLYGQGGTTQMVVEGLAAGGGVSFGTAAIIGSGTSLAFSITYHTLAA
jgi:hypothetical protein